MATCIKLVTPGTATTKGSFEVDDFQEVATHLSEHTPDAMEIAGEIFIFDCEEVIYAMCAAECGIGFARIIEIMRKYYAGTLVANSEYTWDEALTGANAIPMKGFE